MFAVTQGTKTLTKQQMESMQRHSLMLAANEQLMRTISHRVNTSFISQTEEKVTKKRL